MLKPTKKLLFLRGLYKLYPGLSEQIRSYSQTLQLQDCYPEIRLIQHHLIRLPYRTVQRGEIQELHHIVPE